MVPRVSCSLFSLGDRRLRLPMLEPRAIIRLLSAVLVIVRVDRGLGASPLNHRLLTRGETVRLQLKHLEELCLRGRVHR